MAELKPFQKASSDRILEYYKESNNHRYLLADEVGLGKTIIAANVIQRFAEEYRDHGVGVYYVCGNLALVGQNEKKLRDGFEDYNTYQWKESRNENMSRLALSFINQNYYERFDEVLGILKGVAVWMLGKGVEYTKENLYRGDGKTPKKNFLKRISLVSKFLGQYTFNRYAERLKNPEDKYTLLLEIYEKIREKKLIGDCVDVIKEIDKILEGHTYYALGQNEKDRQIEIEKPLLDKLKALIPIYDDLAGTKRMSFQSITPRTSIEKTSSGTWIERVAAGIVYYRWIEKQKEKSSQQFEEMLDMVIRGAKEEKDFAYVSHVMKTGQYMIVKEYWKICTQDACMAMFLYENITDRDIDEITKDMRVSQNAIGEEEIKVFLKNILSRMAVYSLDKAQADKKMLVVVDEFQNYSKILGENKLNEDCIRVCDKLLHSKYTDNHYVLLLSATPFHFANSNIGKNVLFQSEIEEINYEVELVLKYVMGGEPYKEWLETDDAYEKYKYLYENGVSRTERSGVNIGDKYMTLSYTTDIELLKSDVKNFVSFSNFQMEDEIQDGDMVIFYKDMQFVYRNGTFYIASDRIVNEIFEKFEIAPKDFLYEDVEDDDDKESKECINGLFFKCTVWDEEDYVSSPEYEWIECSKNEEKILKNLDAQTLPFTYVKDTPWLLSFAQDYKKINMSSQEREYILHTDDINRYAVEEIHHARFRKLKRILLEDRNAYKLLYIPPSKPDYRLWGIYEEFDNGGNLPVYYSKSLIFSKNYHTPRAFSAMLSYESERLNHADAGMTELYDQRVRYDLAGEKWKEKESEKQNSEWINNEIQEYRKLKAQMKDSSQYSSPYAKCIAKGIKRENRTDIFCLGSLAGYFLDKEDEWECKVTDYELRELLSAIYSVFLTKEAHDILSTIDGDTYMDKIHAYCAQGNFRSVLDEYIHMILEEEHIRKEELKKTIVRGNRSFLGLLKQNYFSVIEQYMKGNQFKIKVHTADMKNMYIYTGFAQGISGEEEKTSNQKAIKNKLICFNSPFRPFVFTSTSVGAEGLDFHWYCRNIYHWALEKNPEKFQQKEGRINRYHCHCVRQNLGRDFATKGWDEIYKYAQEHSDEGDNPFWPEWVYEGQKDDDTYARLTRNTCYYPGSYEDYEYDKMIRNMEIYREIIDGQHLCPIRKMKNDNP